MGTLYQNGQQLFNVAPLKNTYSNDPNSAASAKTVYDLKDALSPIELDLSTLTWNVNYDTTYSYAYKVGKIVIMQIELREAISSTSTQVFSGLPSEFRPSKYAWGIVTEMSAGTSTARVQITMNGEGQVFGAISAASSYFTVIYVTV